PEAAAGGPIGLIEEGDSITIDARELVLNLNIDDAQMAARRKAWSPPKPRYTRGVLGEFSRMASSASRGAVTDDDT
ncbi:MAG: dihydroxy-acid dehydratase, partial [Burkholderiaceae bacterium]